MIVGQMVFEILVKVCATAGISIDTLIDDYLKLTNKTVATRCVAQAVNPLAYQWYAPLCQSEISTESCRGESRTHDIGIR